MSTALEIVDAALAELGLPAANTVYGATANATERQMGALLNRVCKELNAEWDWTRTMREQTFYLESPFETTGDLTEGSRIVTNIPDTTGYSNALAVQLTDGTNQTGLLQSTQVEEVLTSTSVRLNQAAISTVVGADLQFVRNTYELSSSFARYIPDTWWDRTNNWRLIGPISPQTSEWLRSGIVQSGPRRRWRQVGPGPSTWQIWPPPFSTGDTPAILNFEFITLAWAFDSDGEEVTTMTEDTDEPIFPEHVCVLGLKAFFWMTKGFAAAPSMYDMFRQAAERAASQDGGKPTFLLGSTRAREELLDLANVPDGNWPGPDN